MRQSIHFIRPKIVYRVRAVFQAICFLLPLNISLADYPLDTARNQGPKENAVNISDFGAKADSRENTVLAVQQALKFCRNIEKPVLVFPKGRYDFWPQHCIEKEYFESNTTDNNPKRLAIQIEKFKNLTIDGGGSEFIFHDRMQPFTMDSSENVIIKNLKIDWDIPLSAEAEVVDISSSYIDIKLDPCENPYLIDNDRLVFVGEGWKSAWWGTMEFDRETKKVAYRTGDQGCLGQGWNEYKAEELDKGLVRLHHRFKRRPAKGNYLVLRHSARDHAGIFILHSKNITVENVDFYHCAGLGVLAQYSENIMLDNYNAVPNLQKKRILSGHDDGAQISNCKGLATIQNCKFEALMDDPVNVHGTAVRIIKKLADDLLLCKFMHHQSVGMVWARKDDKIGFIENESMCTIDTGSIKSFKAHNNEEFEVRFYGPISELIQPGDALENLTWTPDVNILNNHFASNRARGLLISTPGKVLIEGNLFESSGSAVLIAGDANYWYESGAVKDVLIRNNIFKESCLTSMYQFCEALISIYPEIPSINNTRPAFHRNIRIEENEFQPFDYPVLFARSATDLTFKNNRIVRSYRYKPFHHRKTMLTFDFCRNVKIEGNHFVGDVLGKNVMIKEMEKKDINIGLDQDLSLEISRIEN